MRSEVAEQSKADRLKVGWSGPTSGCFGWLRRRIQETCQVIDLPQEETDPEGIERWVFSSRDRLSLPTSALLDRGIPVAVAANAWWEGSSRTGLREMPTPVIPWYRWWDGWMGWLQGFEPLLSPLPPRLVYGLIPDITGSSVAAGCGCIISNCRQTAGVWQHIANSCGQSVEWFTARDIFEPAYCPARILKADWVLWDDSSLDNWRGPAAPTHVVEFLKQARLNKPEVTIIAALTSPRWDEWRLLSEAGAQELIAKPAVATVLTQILAKRRAVAG